MLRRFSTQFKKSKGDRESKQNGTPGPANNSSKRQSKLAQPRKSSSSSSDGERSAKNEDGVPAFEKYAQVLHASRSPLPNQTGDGATSAHDHQTTLFQDLRSFGFKDFGTLKEVIATKAKGEHVDDKTMVMERIIQVGCATPGT
jgi:linoleate 10R-lipoxygenase